MSITDPLLIMSPHLRRSNNIRLRLNRSRPQQHFPVRLTRWDGEGGGVGDDLCAEATEGEADFWETELFLAENSVSHVPYIDTF